MARKVRQWTAKEFAALAEKNQACTSACIWMARQIRRKPTMSAVELIDRYLGSVHMRNGRGWLVSAWYTMVRYSKVWQEVVDLSPKVWSSTTSSRDLFYADHLKATFGDVDPEVLV